MGFEPKIFPHRCEQRGVLKREKEIFTGVFLELCDTPVSTASLLAIISFWAASAASEASRTFEVFL